MLKPTDHNAGCNTFHSREVPDLSLRREPAPPKAFQRAFGYQEVCRELVCLQFLRSVAAVRLQEPISLSVEQDMPGLMEEGEPELVVRAVTKAQLKERLRRGQPSRCA